MAVEAAHFTASPIERLTRTLRTYQELSSDSTIDPAELTPLKIEMSDLIFSMEPPRYGDDEMVRTVYCTALEILTQENRVLPADPLPLRKRSVKAVTDVGSAVIDKVKKLSQNRKGLLYAGGAALMYCIGGLSSLGIVAILFAAEKMEPETPELAELMKIKFVDATKTQADRRTGR